MLVIVRGLTPNYHLLCSHHHYLDEIWRAITLPRLIIYEDSEDADTIFETFELSDRSILIGSDPDNHLILKTPEIDPSHASLELRNHEWVLQDLGGAGGTAVNGKIIEGPHSLYHDDLIELGYIKMRFQDPERGVTKEFPRSSSNHEAEHVHEQKEERVHISGRIWFATVATATLAVIFIIIFLLIFAQVLGVINLGGLVPP